MCLFTWLFNQHQWTSQQGSPFFSRSMFWKHVRSHNLHVSVPTAKKTDPFLRPQFPPALHYMYLFNCPMDESKNSPFFRFFRYAAVLPTGLEFHKESTCQFRTMLSDHGCSVSCSRTRVQHVADVFAPNPSLSACMSLFELYCLTCALHQLAKKPPAPV